MTSFFDVCNGRICNGDRYAPFTGLYNTPGYDVPHFTLLVKPNQTAIKVFYFSIFIYFITHSANRQYSGGGCTKRSKE